MDRIELLHAIDVRHSCRRFSNARLSTEMIDRIGTVIEEINSFSGMHLEFAEDGSRAFASVLKTYGLFKNVRSLILVKGKKDIPELAEKAGYFGEELVLELTAMGIGTCWVAGTYDKKTLSVPADEQLLCVIPAGYPEQEDFFVPQTSRKRKSPDKRYRLINIDKDTKIPQWFMDGIAAMCQAPSAVNSQKPYIEVHDSNFASEGMTSGKDDLDFIDLGIAERHFSIGADKCTTTAYFLGEFHRN